MVQAVNPLTNISPIDGRYQRVSATLGETLSEHALMKQRVRVELEWLRFLMQQTPQGLRGITAQEDVWIDGFLKSYSLEDSQRIKEIERTTRHDVKAVEYFIRERLRGQTLEDVGEWVHFACTSEDINNLAYALMLREAMQTRLLPAMNRVVGRIAALAVQERATPMMARTHGQPASPTTLGKELAVFVARLERQRSQLGAQEFLGKFGGAVGNFNAHTSSHPEVNWPALAKAFVEERLGLRYNALTTQIEPHDWMAELFHAQVRFNQILLGFNQDVWGYIALGFFKQRPVAGEIGSSTMPHKVNPIDFENSEANLGLANAALLHLAGKLQISRWQRDLSDSSALRNVGVGLAHTLVALTSLGVGLGKLEVSRAQLHEDLRHEWALLAEPIQTVMRKVGLAGGYERLKDLTRGEAVTETTMQEFIGSLEIPAPDKARLLALRPETYTGLAEDLVQTIAHLAHVEAGDQTP